MCSDLIFFHIRPAANSVFYIQTFTSPYFFSLNLISASTSLLAPGVSSFHICLPYILHTMRTRLSALCHCRQHFLLLLFFCSCCHLCFTLIFRMHICFFRFLLSGFGFSCQFSVYLHLKLSKNFTYIKFTISLLSFYLVQ